VIGVDEGEMGGEKEFNGKCSREQGLSNAKTRGNYTLRKVAKRRETSATEMLPS